MSEVETDVIVIGAGHNGLVAALLLARSGLRVHVLEDKYMVGGAVRTEKPFKKAPDLGISTGAYLLGLVPPELMRILGVDIPLHRRDPHYFLPTREKRYLMFGSDAAATKHQFIEFFSEADWRANEAMTAEIGKLRDDIAPTWLHEPLSIEQTADKFVRPELQQAFVDLCRGSVGDYLARFDFKSDLVRAMYAVTAVDAVRSYSPRTGAMSQENAVNRPSPSPLTISCTRRSCRSLTKDHRNETARDSTPAAMRLSTAPATSASSRATTMSPSRSMRSLTPRISSLGMMGAGLASLEEWTSSRSCSPAILEYTRPTIRLSSCPCVVMRPVRAPPRSSIALVAWVVPWTNIVVRSSNSPVDIPSDAALTPTASSTPSWRDPRVVSDLEMLRSPRPPTTTQSVKVPPMSTPIR